MSNLNADWQVLDAELAPVVESLLKDMGAETLTVDDVLSMATKPAKEVRVLAVQFFWKMKQEREAVEQSEEALEEARKRYELGQKKADEAARISAMLREKMGMKPLTPESLQEQVGAVATNGKVVADIFPSSEIPEAVIELSKKFNRMLHSDVFENSDSAVTFRGWLAFWHKHLQRETSNNDLSPEQKDAWEGLEMKMKTIFDTITEVVVAWGFDDPRSARTSRNHFNALRDQMEVEGSKFYWMTQRPAVETPEEKAAREQEKAVREAERNRFDELVAKLRDQLTVTDNNLAVEDAEKMAKTLAKKYGNLPDIMAIFSTAATNRMASANGTPYEEGVAKRFAKAGLMTDEEFEAAVKQRIENLKVEPKAKVYNDMKPETMAINIAKKNGKKNKKAGNKKR